MSQEDLEEHKLLSYQRLGLINHIDGLKYKLEELKTSHGVKEILSNLEMLKQEIKEEQNKYEQELQHKTLLQYSESTIPIATDAEHHQPDPLPPNTVEVSPMLPASTTDSPNNIAPDQSGSAIHYAANFNSQFPPLVPTKADTDPPPDPTLPSDGKQSRKGKHSLNQQRLAPT